MAKDSLNDLVPSNNPSSIDNFTPQIYVVCSATYKAGKLHGIWINATQNLEFIDEQIQKMLANCPCPNAKIWTIYDYYRFGSLRPEDIEEVQSMANFITVHGQLGIALLDFFENLDLAKTTLENHYHGEFKNQLAFATELFVKTHLCDIPEKLQNYVSINYATFKRDIFRDEFFLLKVAGKNHVFSFPECPAG